MEFFCEKLFLKNRSLKQNMLLTT